MSEAQYYRVWLAMCEFKKALEAAGINNAGISIHNDCAMCLQPDTPEFLTYHDGISFEEEYDQYEFIRRVLNGEF